MKKTEAESLATVHTIHLENKKINEITGNEQTNIITQDN